MILLFPLSHSEGVGFVSSQKYQGIEGWSSFESVNHAFCNEVKIQHRRQENEHHSKEIKCKRKRRIQLLLPECSRSIRQQPQYRRGIESQSKEEDIIDTHNVAHEREIADIAAVDTRIASNSDHIFSSRLRRSQTDLVGAERGDDLELDNAVREHKDAAKWPNKKPTRWRE